MVINGVSYSGDHIRYPVEGSGVDGFVMGVTSTDTNGKNIDLLAGIVSDLITHINQLNKRIATLECLNEV